MFGPSNVLIICTVGLSTTPRIARIIRGAAISVVKRDFISAAEALGESRRRVVLAEVLPNVTSSLLVEMNLRLTYSVGLIASLAFLGFTPEPNAANWGLMIQENRVALTEQPWGVILPTVALALMTIGTGLISFSIIASQSSFLSSLAIQHGADSTISLASLRPRPRIALISLMILILPEASNFDNSTSKWVFSFAGSFSSFFSSAAAGAPP